MPNEVPCKLCGKPKKRGKKHTCKQEDIRQHYHGDCIPPPPPPSRSDRSVAYRLFTGFQSSLTEDYGDNTMAVARAVSNGE